MSDQASLHRRRLNVFLIILLIPGLLSALYLAICRYNAETLNNAVELVMDYEELQILSAASGIPIAELLHQFKEAGATGVAVTEETVGDLVSNGQASYQRRPFGKDGLTAVIAKDSRIHRSIIKKMHARLPEETYLSLSDVLSDEKWKKVNAEPVYYLFRGSPSTLDTIGVGLPSEDIETIRSFGLDVAARLQNYPAMSKKGIDASSSDLKKMGITRLIFAGEEVLGFKGLVNYTAKKIESEGMTYCSIEFGKQKGDAGMSRALNSVFIRAHSISPAELAGMSTNTASERFNRAVRERGIRLCYIRLPQTVADDPVGDGVSFVSGLRRDIEAAGYRIGTAKPLQPIVRPLILLLLIGIAISAGAVLLLSSLATIRPILLIGLLVIGILVAAMLIYIGEKGIQLLALTSALVFPALGVVALIGPHFRGEQEAKSPILRAVLIFVGVSIISLFGAAMIIGLLADRSYMVKVNQFVGVKAAHLLPLLIVIGVMAAGLPVFDKSMSEVWHAVKSNFRRLASHPLFVWHALAVVLALGIIGLAMMRTGNDPGIGVSGFEMKFRVLLDKLLSVRPRTKEFMVGHPALIVGTALLLLCRRAWCLTLVAFGVLGQVSMVNTFCHIHTPLEISVLRTVNGLVIGLIIGLIVWALLGRKQPANRDSKH